MKWAGILVLIASIITGLALVAWGLMGGGSGDLAQAQFGCETTLRFDAAGDYWIYVVDATDESGGCEPTFSGDDLDLTITDGSGSELALRRDRSQTASVDDTDVESEYRFELEEAGEYTLRAQSPQTGTSVAIGGEGGSGWLPLAIAGGLVAVLGGGLGLLLMRRGARRAVATSSAPADDVTSSPGQIDAPARLPQMPQRPPSGSSGSTLASPPGTAPPPPRPPAPPTPAEPTQPVDPWAPPSTDERRG